ncbi:hypothetical protein PTKIN_Ptkin06aG0086100 [Pterospermum kingtungense]
MKKLCMTRLLVVPQLHNLNDIRDQEKVKLMESMIKCFKEGKPCDLSSELTTLANNTICRMMLDISRNDKKLKMALLKYGGLVERIIKKHEGECVEDCKVNGFIVKAKTWVLVTVYAVMRDPSSWTNLDEFELERFLESSNERIGEHQMEFKGQNF